MGLNLMDAFWPGLFFGALMGIIVGGLLGPFASVAAGSLLVVVVALIVIQLFLDRRAR